MREVKSNSDRAFRCVSRWIKECQGTHRCPSPPLNPALPSRVLDVSLSDHSVKLVEMRGEKGQYIALSHCWGKSRPLTAIESTVGGLKDGITMSRLPKTFQDAINITKKLGIKYLWIGMILLFYLKNSTSV